MTQERVFAGPTGLGTASTRVGAPEPRFDIPYPSRISPDVERARLEGLRWAREMGIVRDGAETAALDAPRFDRLAAYAYPGHVGAPLDLVVELMLWFFPFDDLFDGPLGRDPAATAALIENLVAGMYAERPPSPFDPPMVRAFLDLWHRARIGTTPSWRTRLHSDSEAYLRSYQWEAANRVRGRVPSVASYVEMRRHSIGVWPSLDVGESTGRFEIPQVAFRSDHVQTMRRLCSDVVVLVNEAYSAAKDHEHGDLNLAVLLEREEGLTARQARARVVAMAEACVADFVRLDAGLDRLCDDLNIPAARPDLERYADGMRSWMRGNLDWSRETVRYRS
ncbi:terpene synthase family protein [Hamadaea tsunoensis]|uniref:terpene synthase family protein n=1 Tax=Hamadaea tsunoensis TaxID=53368 RepID=UPI0004276AB3|nr:hypothetical protein [Hamadaea tsunoensis]